MTVHCRRAKRAIGPDACRLTRMRGAENCAGCGSMPTVDRELGFCAVCGEKQDRLSEAGRCARCEKLTGGDGMQKHCANCGKKIRKVGYGEDEDLCRKCFMDGKPAHAVVTSHAADTDSLPAGPFPAPVDAAAGGTPPAGRLFGLADRLLDKIDDPVSPAVLEHIAAAAYNYSVAARVSAEREAKELGLE